MKRYLSLPLVFIVSLGATSSGAAQQPQEQPKTIQSLTVRDLWKEGGLTGREPEQVKWSPDGSKVSYVLRDDAGERGGLWYIDAHSGMGKPAVLVAAEKLWGLAPHAATKVDERKQERKHNNFGGCYWAPDSKHLLFDSKGQLWYFRLDTGTATQMTAASDPQQDPKFSPDGHYISYVKKHQIFVRGIDASGDHEVQLTTAKESVPKQRFEDSAKDPKLEGNILNGEVDWLYAEELNVKSNYFWSPDSKQIAFLQMDETNVPVYPIEDFIPKHPVVDEEKYPKAGDQNPGVRVGVVSREGGKVRWMPVPQRLGDLKNLYIPQFGWVNDHVLYAMVLNRSQNQLDLVFSDLKTGRSRVVLEDKSATFIDIEKQTFQVFQSRDRFIISSWRDGHTHLYLYGFDKADPTAADAKLISQVTKGAFEVSALDEIDETNGIAYYESNELGPNEDQFAAWRENQVVARKLDGTRLWGYFGGTHEATFASDGKHFVEMTSSYAKPPEMRFCVLGASEPKCSDPFFRSRQLTFQLSTPTWLQIKAEDGTPLEAMLLMPPNVPAGQKVPVILNPYGGPGAQKVLDTWTGSNAAFDDILLRDGFAVLRVDNRGMGGRGREFASALYGHLGDIEFKDQIAALDQTLVQYPQLDASRIGWWGWSYGGYLTLYAMTHTDRIKAGIAVAPVTNWELYDSTYTERYMNTPKENAEGYRKSSPVNFAAQLHGTLLEVHGTSDDNVHMQNTIQMIQAFIEADKQYSLLLYPRKTHGIAGEAARTQLFERIEQHFLQNLK